MRVDANGSGEKNFYPNTEEYLSSDNFIDEQINSSYYSRQYPIDDFTQPQNLLKLFTEEQKETLVENLSNSMKNIPNNIKERQICHFYRLDNEFAFLLSENLGIDFLKIKELSKLSFPELIKATSKKDERMGKIS
jgi:catalase